MRTKARRAPAAIISLAEKRCRRVDLQRGTLTEAWECYVASGAMGTLKRPSRLVYAQAVREAVAALPPRPTAADIQLWLEGVVRDGRSPVTANKLLRALKAVTERASLLQRGGDLTLRRAFRLVRVFRLPPRARRDASEATVRRLLELAQGDPCQSLAIRLAAFYGLRRGEISALRPSDVHVDGGRVTVRVERTRDAHGERSRKNSHNGRAHILCIDDAETASLVVRLLDATTRVQLAHREQRQVAHIYLLPWGHAYPSRLMDRWRRDAGVTLPPGDAWHALRHFGATQLARDGAVQTEIQAWLGDSTATAAMCYMGQVRGTTMGSSARILRGFEGGNTQGG